jgi:hypothetical protein
MGNWELFENENFSHFPYESRDNIFQDFVNFFTVFLRKEN